MKIITVNNREHVVQDHWFWEQFEKEFWEEQTYNIFQKYIDSDTVYIDIGAWIGATIFYACEFTKMPIYAVEANPLSCDMLYENCKNLNITIANTCITDKDNIWVNFGGKDNQKNTSSASSINGNCWMIKSKTLLSYLSENGLLESDKLFIKIDIEGAEELILRDLEFLRYFADITVYLSIHCPFMKDKKSFCDKLLSFCYDYKTVLDSNMQELPKDRLEQMIMTDEQYPEWGTKYGNFFEIVLSNKG